LLCGAGCCELWLLGERAIFMFASAPPASPFLALSDLELPLGFCGAAELVFVFEFWEFAFCARLIAFTLESFVPATSVAIITPVKTSTAAIRVLSRGDFIILSICFFSFE